MNTGLVSEARNAKPLDASPTRGEKRSSPGLLARSFSNGSSSDSSDDDKTPFHTPQDEADEGLLPSPTMPATTAVPGARRSTWTRRSGRISRRCKRHVLRGSLRPMLRYTGRALAEWSLVVNENNSFVDRRRDEGVLGLASVEVPMLNMEGFGLRGARG